jgi:hypothetical protein
MVKRYVLVDDTEADPTQVNLELGPAYPTHVASPPTLGKKFLEDFGEFCKQTIIIEPFVRNDGYKPVYGSGISSPCAIEYKIFNITKSDGQLGPTSAQIYTAGDVVVSLQDKITFNNISPKILRIGIDYDVEDPEEVYGKVIYT